MNILVLVKQVPNTTEMMIDKENGTLIRAGVESIANPDDLTGVELALELKEKTNGHVRVITMGPTQAEDMLRGLYGMGVDDAVLLTDKRFAGSDTWATSNILSAAIKRYPYDLIIAGRQAIDGDTAQVGPQVAEALGLPQVTYVHDVTHYETSSLTVIKSLEEEKLTLRLPLPGLITVLSEAREPRYLNVKDVMTAHQKPLETLTFDDLDLSLDAVGLKASPTRVKRTYTKEIVQKSPVQTLSPEDAATLILKHVVGHH